MQPQIWFETQGTEVRRLRGRGMIKISKGWGEQTEIKKNQIGQGRKQQTADCENGLTHYCYMFSQSVTLIEAP